MKKCSFRTIFYDSLMLNAKFSFAAAERFRGENAGKAPCMSIKRFADCIFFKDYAENEGADFKRYLLDKAEKDCEGNE